MEHWGRTSILSQHSTDGKPDRTLTATSGNRRSHTLDSKEGVENQDSCQYGHSGYLLNPAQLHPPFKLENKSPEHHFYAQHQSQVQQHQQFHEYNQQVQPLTPGPTLQSNDGQQARLRRLQLHRHRRKLSARGKACAARPYLENSEYLKYRERTRRDLGPDGKPIWDEVIERAFQNALVAIPPMGRRKAVQHKKTFGRNELIAEWILAETGEERTRKQVSSHIQVLNHYLKGIPEWDAVTIVDGKDTKPLRNQYYHNSIEHQVQELKANRKDQHGYRGTTSHPGPMSILLSNADTDIMNRPIIFPSSIDAFFPIYNLTFEMWVSEPDRMDVALHTYTRLQSSRTSAPSLPLEEIPDWCHLFPALTPIIESWTIATMDDRCEIVLLDASFELMRDFPPKFSKLGISLELNFLPQSLSTQNTTATTTNLLHKLGSFTCLTHMYKRGTLLKEPTYGDCHISTPGSVKPFFESKWWAAAFTQLTEKKRRAEDSKDAAAINSAAEASRNFLLELTVMQQVFVLPLRNGQADLWNSNKSSAAGLGQKRMAILLWRFNQAQDPYVGTTTWQKLVTPPDRLAINSPPVPEVEIMLPAMSLDNTVDNSGICGYSDPFETENHNFLAQHATQQQFDPTIYAYNSNIDQDEELCQDSVSFMTNEMASFAAMHASFSLELSTSQDMNQLQFDLNVADLHGLNHETGAQSQPQVLSNMNFWNSQMPQGEAQNQPLLDLVGMYGFHPEEVMRPLNQQMLQLQQPQTLLEEIHNEDEQVREPLSSFDVRTSQVLQEQMQSFSESQAKHESPWCPLQLDQHHIPGPCDAALTGASRMSELLTGNQVSQQYLSRNSAHSPQHAASVATCSPKWAVHVPTHPALHMHASYLAEQEAHAKSRMEIECMRSQEGDMKSSGFSNLNIDAFDPEDLAAVLSAHNAAEDVIVATEKETDYEQHETGERELHEQSRHGDPEFEEQG